VLKDSKEHPCHHAELKKLNRISGQVEGIKKMIGEHRYCPDILTQLRAVRAALRRVEADILETHLQSCIADAMIGGDKKEATQKIAELKDIFKRFDDE
jgi:DNA-binding FrmR family transcriptional regulator